MKNVILFFVFCFCFLLMNVAYASSDLGQIGELIPNEILAGAGVAMADHFINKSRLKSNSIVEIAIQILILIGRKFLQRR